MRYHLAQDSLITLRDIVDDITFSTFESTDAQGTFTTTPVVVRTSPNLETDTSLSIYIRPIEADFPVHAVGDYSRKVEEYFWLYCQGNKKASVSTIARELVEGLNLKRKQSARTGAQAEPAFIEVVRERDATSPVSVPIKFVKIIEVRMVYWISIGA